LKKIALTVYLPDTYDELMVKAVMASIALGKNLHAALQEGLIWGWDWSDPEVVEHQTTVHQ